MISSVFLWPTIIIIARRERKVIAQGERVKALETLPDGSRQLVQPGSQKRHPLSTPFRGLDMPLDIEPSPSSHPGPYTTTSTANTSLANFRCAFLSGGSYPDGNLPNYSPFVLRSWASAHKHADFYLLLTQFSSWPFSSWIKKALIIIPVVRPDLINDLFAFSRVKGNVTTKAAVDGHALSTLKVVFADFAEIILGIDLSSYSHSGYLEFDVVIDDLERWVLPSYLSSDIIAIRAAPAAHRLTQTDLLFSASTLYGISVSSLSTWTVLFKNTPEWKRAWYHAEMYWRRHSKQKGIDLSFQPTIESALLTGSRASNFFDEVAFPLYIRVGLPRDVEVSYACCQPQVSFPDVGHPEYRRTRPCQIKWINGSIERTCDSLAQLSHYIPHRPRGADCRKLSKCRDFGLDLRWRRTRSDLPCKMQGASTVLPCGHLEATRDHESLFKARIMQPPYSLTSPVLHLSAVKNNRKFFQPPHLGGAQDPLCFRLHPKFGEPC